MTTANIILWPQANGLASLGICLVTSSPSAEGTPIETSDLLKGCMALGSCWQSCGPDELLCSLRPLSSASGARDGDLTGDLSMEARRGSQVWNSVCDYCLGEGRVKLCSSRLYNGQCS